MRINQIMYSVLFNRCPRCHQGKVFEKSNPYDLSNLFRMHPVCEHCQERYEKEPGYFFGAMFVSYGFTAFLFFVILVLDFAFFHLGLTLLYFLIPGVLILSPLIFRWSRLIWLNFFIRYNPELAKKD